MTHIVSQNKALKLCWIWRLTHPDFNGKWKHLISVQLPKLGENIWKCNIHSKDIPYIFTNLHSIFWKEIVQIWCNFNFAKPETLNDIKIQVIWYNSCIRIQQKPIFYKQWYENGILTIADVLDDQGSFLDFDGFCRKYPNVKTNFLTYLSVLQAVPKEWIRECTGSAVNLDVNQYWLNKINMGRSPSKLLYWKLLENVVSMECKVRSKWMEDLHRDIDDDYWESCFKQIYSCTISSNLRIFQYKFLHRIIFLNYRLHKMKIKENSLCTFCEENDETITHFFFDCQVTKLFWKQMLIWLREATGIYIQFSKLEILLGFPDTN